MNKSVLSLAIGLVYQEYGGEGDLSIRTEGWLPENEWATPSDSLYFVWKKGGMTYRGDLDTASLMLNQGYSPRDVANSILFRINIAAKKFKEVVR